MQISKNTKLIIVAVIAISLTIAGIAGASAYLTNPLSENVIDTPLTPTPTPPPTPTPVLAPTEIHLSSNLTIGSFYQGDTLKLIGQLNQPVANVTVTLYNKGVPVQVDGVTVTAQTDETGKAVFERKPLNPFNYSITALV